MTAAGYTGAAWILYAWPARPASSHDIVAKRMTEDEREEDGREQVDWFGRASAAD